MKRLLLVLLMVGVSNAGWRWSHVPVFSNKDADAAHAIGSAYLANSFELIGFKPKTSDKLAIGLGFLWECKDAVVPWEKYGWLGGEGFSFGDLTCDITGVVTNRAFHAIINKVRHKKSTRRLSYDWKNEHFYVSNSRENKGTAQ